MKNENTNTNTTATNNNTTNTNETRGGFTMNENTIRTNEPNDEREYTFKVSYPVIKTDITGTSIIKKVCEVRYPVTVKAEMLDTFKLAVRGTVHGILETENGKRIDELEQKDELTLAEELEMEYRRKFAAQLDSSCETSNPLVNLVACRVLNRPYSFPLATIKKHLTKVGNEVKKCVLEMFDGNTAQLEEATRKVVNDTVPAQVAQLCKDVTCNNEYCRPFRFKTFPKATIHKWVLAGFGLDKNGRLVWKWGGTDDSTIAKMLVTYCCEKMDITVK